MTKKNQQLKIVLTIITTVLLKPTQLLSKIYNLNNIFKSLMNDLLKKTPTRHVLLIGFIFCFFIIFLG